METLEPFLASYWTEVEETKTKTTFFYVSSSTRTPLKPVVPPIKKKLSAFCGEYFNSTRIDKTHGVLGNECFLNGLSFVPNIVFVLAAVPLLISWNKSMFASMHVKTWVRFPHHAIRWLLFLILIVTNIFEVISGFLSDELLGGAHLHLFIPHMVSVVGTLVAVVFYHSVEMWNSPRFLLMLTLYWFFLMAVEIMKTMNLNLSNTASEFMRPHFTRASIALYLLLFVIELDVLRQLRYAFFKKRRILKPPEYLAETNYVQSAVSLPSKATYFWMRSLVNQACKTPLELKDLGSLPKSERSGYNYGKLLAAIEEEKEKQSFDEKVCTSLYKSCWLKSQCMMLLAGLLMLAGTALHLSVPVILVFILNHVDEKAHKKPTNATLPPEGDMVKASVFFSDGYVLSIIMFLICILMSTFQQAGNYIVIREGVRIRGALQLLMYGKVLCLSLWNFASKTMTMSNVVGLLSMDVNNVLFCSCVIHFIWLLPLKTLAAAALLYNRIGLSALIGLLLVLLLTFLQCLVARRLSYDQKNISRLAETRLRKCTEMLQNIKCLKLYAWENVIAKKVEDARSAQLTAMLKTASLKAVTTFILEASNLLVMMAAFSIYPYLEKESLTPQRVFPAIILFDIIASPIQILPALLNFVDHAIDSTKNIASFLTSYEIDSKRHQTAKPKFHKASSYLQHSAHATSGHEQGHGRGSIRSSDSDKVKMTLGSGDEEEGCGSGGGGVPLSARKSFMETDPPVEEKRNGEKVIEEISMTLLESESRKSMLGPQSAAILASHLSVIHEAEQQQTQQQQQQQHHLKSEDIKKSRKSSTAKPGKAKKSKKPAKAHHGKHAKETETIAPQNVLGKSLETESAPAFHPPAVENESKEKTKVCAMLSVPSVVSMTSEVERNVRQGAARSCSRRTSQHDILSTILMNMMSSNNKRTPSILSASNSMGSGLDDDDLIDPDRDVGVAVDVSGGYFAWEPDSPEPLLTEIDFKADAGRLTVIVGAFGSGKSSLVAAVLGEMNRMSGSIKWKPGLTTCYSGSTPWLLNASLQENILFGQPMERKRYKRVLRACALQQDIDILPEKDLTEIGSKGISLSVGQRLRVSIARAIYSKADLVVLDDPFSALDLPIASHIFEDGILHFCLVKRKRTVILVTHELHFLPFAHAIYQVENGCLQFHGRLQDVKENNPQLFATWQEGLRKARKENQLRAEREETTNTERLVLLRKIRTLEFRRELAKSVINDIKKNGSPKRVLLTGQTNHITIEEEHPGVEDDPATCHKTGGDDDDDDGVNEYDQSGMAGVDPVIRNKIESKSLISRKKRQQLQQHLIMMNVNSTQNGGTGRALKGISLIPHVRLSIGAIFAYVKAAGIPIVMFLLACHLARVFLIVSSDVWLSHWSYEVSNDSTSSFNNTTAYWSNNFKELEAVTVSLTYDTPTTKPDEAFVLMYVILTSSAILFCLVIAFFTEVVNLRSSRILYVKMLRCVVQAPMKFFDSNPISKINSRLSGDVTVIDEKLATTLAHFLRTFLLLIGSVVVNGYMTLYFLVPGLIILLGFFYYQHRFRHAYRELHKLDSVTKGPLISHCSETLTGLRTIRAFHDEIRFWNDMERLVNNNNSTHLWLNTANRWIGVRLDYLASVMVFMSCIVGISVDVPSSLVGLGVTYSVLTCGYVNWAVRNVADADVQMTAVQRIFEYSHLPSENDKPTKGDSEETVEVAEDWPAKGELIFYNVSILYSGHAVPVARNVNIHIRPGEKVGICGKPGCGKSSLILSLFGLVDLCEGSIYIDGCKINNIQPRVLRSRLAVLPQDCMLLSGTIRFNLDPEGIHTDENIWEVLDQVSLKDSIKYLSGQLEAVVSDDGENFSISDKQLLCLARAILKKSKFIIIDEVMSVLNQNTEMILQRILRTAFNDRTVINLSHRPASLMNYDTVVVLDNGLVVEHDTPQNLAQLEGGVFASLLKKKPS